jgi:hypothetical protein
MATAKKAYAIRFDRYDGEILTENNFFAAVFAGKEAAETEAASFLRRHPRGYELTVVEAPAWLTAAR